MYEENIIRKKWGKNHLKIALVYPNKYSAMAGLTIQTLYHIWNRLPNVLCERFFMPMKLKKSKYSQYTTKIHPTIRSIENNMLLKDFDIIAFSISYELDYPNLCWILDNSNVPILREDRNKKRTEKKQNNNQNKYFFPLIMAGGPVVRSNPLPIEPFIDAAFIGELEPSNSSFIKAWFRSFNDIESNHNYSEIQSSFLQTISAIPGFYIPLFFSGSESKIERVIVKNLDDFNHLHPIRQIVPKFPINEKNPLPFGESLFIEVNRGCPHFCKFCLTGWQLNPFRNRNIENLKNLIKQGLEKTNLKKVVLIGSSVTEHPHFDELCRFLTKEMKDIEFSIPSIRIETLTPEIANFISQSGMKTVAIAPETGTTKLRLSLNKKITNEEIIQGAELLLDAGIPNIKLYILYGLPNETNEDLDAIGNLAKKIAALGYGRNGVRLSVNPFIPKAHTPFEHCVDFYLDPNLSELKQKLKRIKKPLEGDVQIKFETLPVEEAFIQALFALGDKKIHTLILQCFKLGQNFKKWYKYIKKNYNSESFAYFRNYFNGIHKSKFGENKWNLISEGIPIRILKDHYEKSY